MRALLAAAVAALALTGGTAALAAPAGPTGDPGPAVAPSVVTLPTGDAVLFSPAGVGSSGASSIRALPGPDGRAADLHVVHVGAHTYVLPRSARRYLGGVLDVSLFDVQRLAALPAGQRLAVTLGLRAGSTPQVPGLTVTARTATSASGYLTAASARAFGQALAEQGERDVPAGELFGGLTSLRSAGAVTPVASPAFQQVTLTVRVLDGAGEPVPFGELAVVDVDDARRYASFTTVVAGVARISVPLGHYSAISVADDLTGGPGGFAQRLVPVSDFTVSGAGQTLLLDGRTATTSPSVRTPRPAALDEQSVEWDRVDATGRGGLGFGVGSGPGGSTLVAPAPAPRTGAAHWLDTWSLSGASASGDAYTYDLRYASEDVPADQSFVVADRELSTLRSRYYGHTPRTSLAGRLPLEPYQFFALGGLRPFRTPTVRTEYARSAAGTRWSSALVDDVPSPVTTFVTDAFRRYAAATGSSTSWLRPVLSTGLPEAVEEGGPSLCMACRDDDVLSLSLAPLLDSTPGHAGDVEAQPGSGDLARLRVLRGDTVVLDRRNTLSARWTAPAEPGTYRVLAEVDRRVAGRPTASTTELTFGSARGSGPALPASVQCLGPARGTCRALPLLQVRAPLPVDLHGVLPIGTSPVTVTVRHAAGAATTPVTALRLETSRDGTAWQGQPATRLSDGRYQVQLTNPAGWAGAAVWVRLSASDAAGATLRQTVQNAFLVADR